MKEINKVPLTPDRIPMEIEWETIFSAKTRKGEVAQFVNQIHLRRPEKAIRKIVHNARSENTIRETIQAGLDEGFSIGIATCFFSTSMMEDAPYWAGRTGIHSHRKLDAFINGDPEWQCFADDIPEDKRGKYWWIPMGLKNLNTISGGPAEIVVNHHPKGYGLKPQNHYVAHLYRPPSMERAPRDLEIAIAPDTYNTRALGGNLDRSKTIHLSIPYGKFTSSAILTVGEKLFTPESKAAINTVIAALRLTNIKAKEKTEHHNPELIYNLLEKVLHSRPARISALQDIKTEVETSFEILEALMMSGVTQRAKEGKLSSPEAILAINQALKQEKWMNFVINPHTYKAMLLPKARTLIDNVVDNIVRDETQLWDDLLDTIEGPLSERFEPVLEFIGPPLQLYEVKEKARR